MKKTKAIVSLLLVFAVIAGLFIPCSARTATSALTPGPVKRGFSLKNNVFYDFLTVPGNIPMTALMTALKALRFTMYFFSGSFLFGPPKTLDISLSQDIIGLCDYMNEHSSLDLYSIITDFPDVNDPAKLAGFVFQIDAKEYRAQMYELRDEYLESGNETLARIAWVVGSYLGGVEKVEIYTVPYEDVSEVELRVSYPDGSSELLHPNILIDFETGKCYDKYDKGMVYMGFDNNLYDLLVYAPMYCWMRDFGFCAEYDLICYLLPMYRYRTRRFKFNYDGRDWMIQCWKGNYMCTNGGEVGIYNRPEGKAGSYYDSITDDELMPMSMTVSHGDELLVNIPETPHWWVNGFKLSDSLYHPMSMTETFTVTFPDEEMRDAFCKAVESNIYHDVEYSADGLTVTCVW